MPRKVRISIKLGLLALLLCAAAALAQDSQDKIRAKVDLVVVPVTVKGNTDNLIAGLTKDDFVIYESGRKQTISNFTSDPVPLSAAVVVDTGLSAKTLSKVQQTFGALSGAFSEYDEVALYQYDKFVTKTLDFTKNMNSVDIEAKKIRELKPDPNPALANNPRSPFGVQGPVINGFPVLPPGYDGTIQGPPPTPSKVLNDALFTAAADLGKRERNRRKMILVISDGVSSGSDHSNNDVQQILLNLGIQVYAVALDEPFPLKKLSVLDDYAKMSGGDTYFVGSIQHIEKSYMTATEEARNQYVIGYISNNEVSGNGPVFRDIDVQVAGRMKTLHRKGYYAYP